MRYLAERDIGFPFGRGVVPIVPAAILFDLGIGRHDRWPTIDSGYRAAASARSRTAEGNVGAGMGATVGKALGPERAMKGGLGTASVTTASGLTVAALVAVNAAGDIIDPATGHIMAGARGTPRQDVPRRAHDPRNGGKVDQPQPAENTTIGLVATNARLTKAQAREGRRHGTRWFRSRHRSGPHDGRRRHHLRDRDRIVCR